MLRDNLVGLIEPMRISARIDPLALSIQKQASDDRSSCLENPRPEGAESSLTENVTSPFQAEPAQVLVRLAMANRESGDSTTAKTNFDEALELVDGFPPQEHFADFYRQSIAEARMEVGDVEGADR